MACQSLPHRPQDVEHGRHGAFAQLVDRFDVSLKDVVPQRGQIARNGKGGPRTADMQMEELNQPLQRGCDVGRVPGEQPDDAEALQAAMLADQQTNTGIRPSPRSGRGCVLSSQTK
jgi:hypothetical protein